MSAKEIASGALGLPRFAASPAADAEIFALGSHARARAALDFGLSVTGVGFNIFVVGEDRAARMTATLAHLEASVAKLPPADDWVYLDNFRHPANPTPHVLPAGTGRRFRDAVVASMPRLRESLAASFSAEAYQARLLAMRDEAGKEVSSDLESLAHAAESHGLRLTQGDDGAFRLMPAKEGAAVTLDRSTEQEMAVALSRVQLHAVTARAQLTTRVMELNRGIAAEVINPALDALARDYAAYTGLVAWLAEARADMIGSHERFQIQPGTQAEHDMPERRYAVNLLVDHGEDKHPLVVLETNPTYENLFGWIEYRQAQGSIQTDFTMIRAGALHRANGGVLLLRAEALAANPASWLFLKAALRDGEIRTEELARREQPPIAGAPKPCPVPLAVKVVIVGAPFWYMTFFDGDPDFRTYFKVTADIDSDTQATPANLAIYAGLLDASAQAQGLDGIAAPAMTRLLGIASRWAERRDRLSARVELVQDIVREAAVFARSAGKKKLEEDAVIACYDARSRRNARIEERMLQSILDGTMLIDTVGGAIGQINALTVNAVGDHQFGGPVRVTARAYAGRDGVINIERDIGTGGPIQQKGAKVLQGYLTSRFAQTRPLAFSCSITFEQVYGGVEGDSASMAELVATLSDLAQLPIRQDLAITGSVNQAGHAQAIGGAHWKIEGFFRVCAAKPGGLTGTQGVIVPESNLIHLTLRDEVVEAVAKGRFHLWSVASVEEAAALLLGMPAGEPDAAGAYPPQSIFGRIAARLDRFERILADEVRPD